MNVNFEPIIRGLKVIFLKCKIRFIYVVFNCKRKKWGKKMSGNFLPLRGVWPLHGKCPSNFHFILNLFLNNSVPLIFCSGYEVGSWHSYSYYSKKTPRPVPWGCVIIKKMKHHAGCHVKKHPARCQKKQYSYPLIKKMLRDKHGALQNENMIILCYPRGVTTDLLDV